MSIFLDTRGHQNYGIGICARCSRKFPLDELYSDPNAQGLKVCKDDKDKYDPYRLPGPVPEKINLPFARPDTDIGTNASYTVGKVYGDLHPNTGFTPEV